jgi:YidC/Oxa1 family membrane protein insertase
MDDQRRVLIAIALTLAIFLAWQWVLKVTHPPVLPPAAERPEGGAESSPAGPASQGAPPAPPAVGQEKAAPPAAPPTPPMLRVGPETVMPFETPLVTGAFSSAAALKELLLRRYKEEHAKEKGLGPVSLVTADIGGALRQAVVSVDVGGTRVQRFEMTRDGADRFVLSAVTAQGVRAQLTVGIRKNEYGLDYALSLENTGHASVKASLAVAMGLTPNPAEGERSMFTPAADEVSGVCSVDGTAHRLTAKSVENGPKVFSGAQWAGLDRQYFVVALVPQEGAGQCQVSAREKTVLVDYALGSTNLAPGKTWQRHFVLFVGPKRSSDLEAVSPELANVIDYNIWKIPLGFLARPMVALLNVFHNWTASWGVAIILLTVLVKAVLFPITYKSVVSMRRMQLIKPELDKLKERYAGDQSRLQQEQMKLFREKGVNPLGGCLPMLLQMPVWFALYRMLWTDVDLYQQKFLWLENLTAKEHFPFLSIAFGILTMAQQKLTPSTIDSQQAKLMMYVMPAVFTVFMIGLPSGLVLYIVVNSILTIIQQLVINRRQV